MTSIPNRNCPVCKSVAPKSLFRQSFTSLSQGSLFTGFELVICNHCGSAYADQIPDQVSFDKYYAEMSKYEYANRAGIQSETDLRRFSEIADLVVPHLDKNSSLLDIGCATGGLLAEFKKRGFKNLLGVDPSPVCAQLTTQLYGIPAKQLTIAHLSQLGKSTDIVFLTGVLEHLRDVDSSLTNIKSCLSNHGFIYIEVPDATRYDHHFSAPFQLFSMEHINYFSPTSLRNLLEAHDFEMVFTERLIRHLSPKTIEPAIGGLFRKANTGECRRELIYDSETETALNKYISKSKVLEKKIESIIYSLVESGKPLAVWGVGTHTLRLLETSVLRKAKIIAFIDSNANYQGKTLAGIPILSPSTFDDPALEILISSQTAEEEIFKTIKEKLRWKNVVHRLYHGHTVEPW